MLVKLPINIKICHQIHVHETEGQNAPNVHIVLWYEENQRMLSRDRNRPFDCRWCISIPSRGKRRGHHSASALHTPLLQVKDEHQIDDPKTKRGCWW